MACDLEFTAEHKEAIAQSRTHASRLAWLSSTANNKTVRGGLWKSWTAKSHPWFFIEDIVNTYVKHTSDDRNSSLLKTCLKRALAVYVITYPYQIRDIVAWSERAKPLKASLGKERGGEKVRERKENQRRETSQHISFLISFFKVFLPLYGNPPCCFTSLSHCSNE